MVQIGTAISLAVAATVAHAGGVTAESSPEQLLHGYRDCFWLAVGLLIPPMVGCFFLKKGRATESIVGKRTETKDEKTNTKVDEKTNGTDDINNKVDMV